MSNATTWEPYENRLDIEELRREVRGGWDEKNAFAEALITLPEVPSVAALRLLQNAAMNWHRSAGRQDVDLMAIARDLQHRLNTDEHRAIPYKTEYEVAAGLWSLIREGLLASPTSLSRNEDTDTVRPAPQFLRPAFPYENPRTPAETEAMLNHMADVHLTPTAEKK